MAQGLSRSFKFTAADRQSIKRKYLNTIKMCFSESCWLIYEGLPWLAFAGIFFVLKKKKGHFEMKSKANNIFRFKELRISVITQTWVRLEMVFF